MNYIEPGLAVISRYIKGLSPVPPIFGRALKQSETVGPFDGLGLEDREGAAMPHVQQVRDRACVIGAGGMIGSGLMRALADSCCGDIVGTVCNEAPYFGPMEGVRLERLDLRDKVAVRGFFLAERPARVFLAATSMCGAEAAERSPATYLQEQLEIQTVLIQAAFEAGVRRLLFVGSARLRPQNAPRILEGPDMLADAGNPCDEIFALARIVGLKMCQYYNRQYGTRFMGVLPTSVYGPGDNFRPCMSRVLPDMLQRLHEAKQARLQSVKLCGRCFVGHDLLHVDDMARACVFLMNLPDEELRRELLRAPGACFITAGSGRVTTVMELAEIAARVVGFDGRLVFDAPRGDGSSCGAVDVSRLESLGWKARIGLEEGVRETYEWYRHNTAHAFWY
jgi:nucleoside-diphosphate-sugar epimerase